MALTYAHAPLSGQGALRFGGRWNPPDHFPVVYFALPRQACLAELRRGIDLTTEQRLGAARNSSGAACVERGRRRGRGEGAP